MAEEKNPIREAVDEIKALNAAFKDEVIAKAKTEVEATKGEVIKLEGQIKDVQTAAIAKDATILQLQEEVKNIMSVKGRSRFVGRAEAEKNLVETIAENIGKNRDMYVKMAGDNSYMGETIKMDTKVATVTSASLSGQAYGNYLDWRPGMEPIGQYRFRQLVRSIQSDVDVVYYPRADNPVGLGSFGRQATEGALKAQVDRTYTMITLTLTPIAGWLTASRQSLRNIPFLQSWLPTSLNEQLMDYEDLDFANTLVAAAAGSSTTTGITVAVERFIYFIKNLMVTKYYPTAIAVDPTVWAEMLVTKPSNYSLPNSVTIDPTSGQVRILGVPVYPVNWLTGRRCIVGDFTKTAIIESEGLTLRTSDSATSQDFQKNLITFLLERVEGLAIFRTQAFITAVV